VDVIVYDRTVMRYLINRETLDGSVQLLPVTFNKQYRSFLMPRGSHLRRRLDPLLVQRINQTDWREVLRTYNLERRTEAGSPIGRSAPRLRPRAPGLPGVPSRGSGRPVMLGLCPRRLVFCATGVRADRLQIGIWSDVIAEAHVQTH
jgi:hypothetical protein